MAPAPVQRIIEIQRLDEVNQRLDSKDDKFLNSVLSDDTDLVNNWILSCPLPAWVKDGQTQRMLYVNPAFCKRYNITGIDYFNKSFSEVWGTEQAEYYQSRDVLVTQLGTPLEYFDTDTLGDRIHLIKWVVLNEDGSAKYLCGVILDHKNKILSI